VRSRILLSTWLDREGEEIARDLSLRSDEGAVLGALCR
jgi:hypothetical protein